MGLIPQNLYIAVHPPDAAEPLDPVTELSYQRTRAGITACSRERV
jgi:hypothetical protein